MAQTQVELALGVITITFPSSTTYFGLLTALSGNSPEGLTVYYAPGDASTDRNLFGALGLQGAGNLSISGVLASTVPGSSSFCSGLEELTTAMFSRTVYSSISVGFDFDFDETEEFTRTLKDVVVRKISMKAGGPLMTGGVNFQFSSSEEGA